jgi:hypothetical protein
MITNNIIGRVFFLKSDFGTGTGFTVEYNDKQYLITARHLFRKDSDKPPFPKIINHKDNIEVSIFHDNIWKTLNVKVYFNKHIDIDIAILSLPFDISHRQKINIESHGLMYGQDAYFLGFPYQMFCDSTGLNNEFPFPFIKKCVFSAYKKGINDEVIFFFDGHNNPGFSGGPIVFVEEKTKETRICAVVRGYIPQVGDINLQQTLANYTENSGIIVSYNSSHATEILKDI